MESRDRISIANLSSNGAIPSRGPETVGSSTGSSTGHPTPAFASYSGQLGDKTYHLQILQHPVTGAEHGAYPLSRLPLSPPLILRLKVSNRKGAQIAIDEEFPFFVAHLHLLNEQAVPIQEQHSNPSQQLLYGTLVAAPQAFKDQAGYRGYFFVFPDVSLRLRGRYRLGISLTRLQTNLLNTQMVGGSTGCLAQVVTDTFDVVTRAQYTAAPVTDLSACLQEQGACFVRQA